VLGFDQLCQKCAVGRPKLNVAVSHAKRSGVLINRPNAVGFQILPMHKIIINSGDRDRNSCGSNSKLTPEDTIITKIMMMMMMKISAILVTGRNINE